MKRFLIVVCVLILLVIAAYLYWMTTPLYAFQEAAIALRNRDEHLFKERVDVDGFLDNLLDDLLTHPAETTPGLNSMQREVGNGAIALAKSTIESEALRSVDRMFAHNRRRELGSLGIDAAFAEAPPASQASGNLSDVLSAATHELTGEVGKMKTVVYSRMEIWAHHHRDTLPGRLLACPVNERGTELKQILSDYGLKPDNFKRISSCSTTSDGAREICIVGLNFYSPRIRNEVTVNIEVSKMGDSDCWRISRVANVRQLLLSLGESYEYDVHALMSASLAGISNASVKNEVKGVAERLKQNSAVKSFMQQIKINLGH